MSLQRITPEQVQRMPGNPEVTYILDRPPYTRYYWNGSSMIEASSASGAGSLAGQPVRSNLLDIFDLSAVSQRRQVSLPNPYTAVGPDLVHPSAKFTPVPWQGKRFWLAYTPYPVANSAYENPCIACSDDGETFTVPAGVTLPLVEKPARGYNADTHLAFSPDGKTMYLMFRERLSAAPTANNVKVMETQDGKTWSAPVTVLAGAYGSQDYASPSVFWDAANNRWGMVSHNLDGGATYPMQISFTAGADIYSGWGAPAAITITNPTAGRTWWHSCFDILPDGRIIGLVQDIVNGGAGAAGALFVAESVDGGLSFQVKKIYSDLGYYRPAFSVMDLSQGVVGIHAWIGRQSGGFSIHREDWVQGADQRAIDAAFVQAGGLGSYPSSVLWLDNFNIADGALGAPLVGAAGVVDTGAFTVVTKRMQSGNAANNRFLITLASADALIDVQSVSAGGQWWVIFRGTGTGDYWRFGCPSSGVNNPQLQNIVGGGINSNITLTNVTSQAGDRVRVVCRGKRFRIYLNGTFVGQFIDTSTRVSTGVKFGVQGDGATAACVFDNLLVMA